MRITDVSRLCCEYIETDADEWPYYRRYAGGTWERSMGESWESVYDTAELERAYQEVRAAQVLSSGGAGANLSPCPFCGSQAVGLVEVDRFRNYSGGSWYIWCRTCHAQGPQAFVAQIARLLWDARAEAHSDRQKGDN